jgi:hypothetical protein
MASDKKRVQKYCRIYNWIEDNDEEFADVMNQLCLDRVADTNKKHPSITFLMPKGKLRNKIVDLAYSDNPEEAANMIISLVLPHGYSSVEDFEHASTNKKVGNKLRYLFPEIKSSGKNSVNFGDKLEISLAKKFAPRDRSRIYIWQIDSGEPPNGYNKYVEKQEYVLPDFSKRTFTKKSTTGGDDDGMSETIMNADNDRRSRFEFARKIEEVVAAQMNKKSMDPLEMYRPFVTQLLDIIFQYHKNTSIKIRPLLDIDPVITFYLLVEPYKTTGDYIVCSDVFNSTLFNRVLGNVLGSTGIDPNSYVKKYKSILDDYNFESNTATVFTKPDKIIDLTNFIKNKLLAENDSTSLPAEIIKIYNILEERNEIVIDTEQPMSNIFPKLLHDHYRVNHNKKLWQDEYRFIIHKCLKNIRSEFDLHRIPVYKDMLNMISKDLRGNNYSSELCIMNNYNKSSSLNTCVKDNFKMTQLFVSCASFLYIGIPTKLASRVNSPIEGTNRLMDEVDKLANVRPSVTPKLSSKIKNHMIDNLKNGYATDGSDGKSDTSDDSDTDVPIKRHSKHVQSISEDTGSMHSTEPSIAVGRGSRHRSSD